MSYGVVKYVFEKLRQNSLKCVLLQVVYAFFICEFWLKGLISLLRLNFLAALKIELYK